MNASAGLQLLARAPLPDAVVELGEILDDVRDQGRLAADIIARVRSLAGKRPLERRTLDVNEVATATLRLVRSDAQRRGVALRTELVSNLPAIAADRVGLQQVVLNLLLNAMDAMDQVDARDRRLVVRTRGLGDSVEVEVSDTGPGIPADRLPLLFDAFFTTKKDGLGLGLAIARSIVEAHGGRIWAEDRGGHGATFHMTLPVQRHRVGAPRPSPRVGAMRARSTRA